MALAIRQKRMVIIICAPPVIMGPGGYMITSSFYGDDYSSNPKTRGRVFLGESIAGELETTGDDDWIRADLNAGGEVQI